MHLSKLGKGRAQPVNMTASPSWFTFLLRFGIPKIAWHIPFPLAVIYSFHRYAVVHLLVVSCLASVGSYMPNSGGQAEQMQARNSFLFSKKCSNTTTAFPYKHVTIQLVDR
jgi:hypothetical protein